MNNYRCRPYTRWASALLAFLALMWVAACGESEPETLAEICAENWDATYCEVHTLEEYTDYQGAATASIEERIFIADVVVRARLLSAADGTLRFRTVEWLKGTGPNSFTVKADTQGRETQWDNQDAILFLARTSEGPGVFTFADTTTWDYGDGLPYIRQYRGALPEGYMLGTRNPVWVPLEEQSGSTRMRGNPLARSLGDRSSYGLAELKRKVAWVTGSSKSPLTRSSNAPSSIPYYHDCVLLALGHMRTLRDKEAYPPTAGRGNPAFESTIESGAPRNTVARFYADITSEEYFEFRLFDGDSSLFRSRVTDNDNRPENAYSHDMVTRRPLPMGVYTFKHETTPYWFKPCEYNYPNTYTNYTIVVEAPPGTVHEAFFDPATTTAGVGYLATTSTTTGVLEPAGFSMRGRDINITGLEWRNGQVVLSFDRTVQLSDGLSFIETDGTAGLYLSQFDATEDLRARTVTWDVSEQPWESGDELMMRMGPIPLPAVRNLTAEANSAGEVVLRWEVAYRAGVNGYRIWRHRPGRDEGPRIYVSDTLSTDTTYTDANSPVPNLTEYRVQAIDRVYNAGESSESVRLGSQ